VGARNAAVIRDSERKLQEELAAGRLPKGWFEKHRPAEAFCLASPKGTAWAMAIESISHGGVTEVAWRLVHVDAQGKEVALGQGAEPFKDVCCTPTDKAEQFRAVDLDGDGEPEILYSVVQEGPEGGGGRSQRVFTFKDGEIRLMKLPFGGPLVDVDGDGRLDILLTHEVEDRMDCPGYSWEKVSAPSFLVRGLPGGTFSATDPVAVEYARKICPSRPARVIEKKGNLIDDEATAKNALCARAWGKPAAEIAAEIEKGCKNFEPRKNCDEVAKRRPGECRHRAVLLSWVGRMPAIFPAKGER
jgi:hypothetical protein